MGRPNKKGLMYYNTDTDRYQNKKIKKLKHSVGPVGVAVYDYIVCEIYRVEGCFLEWNKDCAFDVADYWGLKESLVEEIVISCCAVGLFSKDVFTSGKKLTSLSIQQRYYKICEDAKRKNIVIPESIRLTPEETNLTTSETPINDVVSAQSKVKNSKVNISSSSRACEEKGLTPEETEFTTEETNSEIGPSPSDRLIAAYPQAYSIAAKNWGIPYEEIPKECDKWSDHHIETKTYFADGSHLLNSWKKWCSLYDEKKIKPKQKKNEQVINGKPKFHEAKGLYI